MFCIHPPPSWEGVWLMPVQLVCTYLRLFQVCFKSSSQMATCPKKAVLVTLSSFCQFLSLWNVYFCSLEVNRKKKEESRNSHPFPSLQLNNLFRQLSDRIRKQLRGNLLMGILPSLAASVPEYIRKGLCFFF